jgi:hypothetical protein
LGAAKVDVGIRGSSMRISPHLHTTEEDVGRVFAARDEALGETESYAGGGHDALYRSAHGSATLNCGFVTAL